MTVQLDGASRLIPILGDPIAQVKAPAGLSAEFTRRGHNILVVPWHVAPPQFDGAIAALATVQNVAGFIATVPHKFAAAARCTTLSDRARFLGAVNVVRRGPEGWHGDMVDGLGYVRGLAASGCTLPGARALLVGAGGAGSAIALAVLDAGAASLAVHDTDVAKRDALIARLSQVHAGKVVAGSADPAPFDLVINATPRGMRADDPLPFAADALRPQTFVGDVITMPEITPQLAQAQAKGCRIFTGVGMFENSLALMAEFYLGG
ncbi:shikimate dehydrogenase family protein [Bradyrhizobium sp. 2TAF24]|uniref:shikimate dehydrogenase family protein n=1 Tax=Bradyrhizobium sp. 2TAF24 TaxID=3233011 RepID=UPI003F91C0C2